MERQWMVAFGTAFDGLTFHGPFETQDDAEIYAEEQGEPYEIVPIEAPEWNPQDEQSD